MSAHWTPEALQTTRSSGSPAKLVRSIEYDPPVVPTHAPAESFVHQIGVRLVWIPNCATWSLVKISTMTPGQGVSFASSHAGTSMVAETDAELTVSELSSSDWESGASWNGKTTACGPPGSTSTSVAFAIPTVGAPGFGAVMVATQATETITTAETIANSRMRGLRGIPVRPVGGAGGTVRAGEAEDESAAAMSTSTPDSSMEYIGEPGGGRRGRRRGSHESAVR